MGGLALHRIWQRYHLPLLVGGYFLYVWLRLNPGLLFEASPRFPAYLGGWDFAGPFLLHPGGPGEYATAWLAQWFRFSWSGAVVITAVTAVLCLAFDRYLASLSGRRRAWPALLPAMLTLVIYGQFLFDLGNVLPVAVAVAAAALYAAWGTAPLPRRVALFAVLSAVSYYALGSPYLVFVVLCAIFEMGAGAGRLAGLLYLLSAEAVPQLIGVMLLNQVTMAAYTRHSPMGDSLDPAGRATLALLWVALFLVAGLTARRGRADDAPASPSVGWWPRVRPVAIAALLILPGVLTYARVPRVVLEVAQLLHQERYEDILRLARRTHFKTPLVQLVHGTNQALSHLGRLSEDMFRYPQGPEGLMVGMMGGDRLRPSQVRGLRSTLPFAVECCEAYLDLGLVNQAEREASESLENRGPMARVLRVLARAHLVKGRLEAARHVLRVMARTADGRAWARDTLARLDADPTLKSDADTTRLRACMPLQDIPYPDLELERQCQALLARNPTNRPAYEYLMAYYLLNRKLDQFAALAERLPQLGYTDIPRPWQEALVMVQAMSHRAVGLPGYRVSSDVAADFGRFSDIVVPYANQQRLPEAVALTAADFGNTYFYYFNFGLSGVGRP